MRFLAKTLLVFAFLSCAPAFAREEPPSRVGRVSLVSGTLAFYGPGDTDWSSAKVNLPVAAGAWLMTDPQSRAEMRVGADSINLSNDTQLNFAELRDQVMQIGLTQGRIDLHLRRLKKDQRAQIDVPRGGLWLLQPGVYDIDSGHPDQPTRITVFEGSARFAGGGIDTLVNAGEMLVVSGSDTLSAAVERAAPDEFVRWCRSHDYDEKRLATPHHVSPAMTGYEELDAYGEWATVPTYGEVWFPTSVPGGWAPYREGRWVWIEPWGWNWVDDEPWGFAPCHYGRWARLDDRWAWVPGEFAPEPVYAPALVAFIPPPAIAVPVPIQVAAGPPVGWFPLAPGEVYWPAYTRNLTYIRNVNITNVNITKINTIIAAQPVTADPPPQIVSQQFANRAAATVVPARVLVESGQVAPAAVAVPPQVLRRAAVAITPPVLPRPAATAPTAPLLTSAPASPPSGRAMPPAASGVMAPTQPPSSRGVQSKPTAPAPTHPPAGPNFSQLAPAPRVSPLPEASQRPLATPPSAQATPAGARQPSAPAASAPQPEASASPPASMPTQPPGAPDFSHLAPAQIGSHAVPQPVQVVPGTSSPAAHAAPSETRQPASEIPTTHAPAPTTPPGATAEHPPGPPDFSHLPPARQGPQPPPYPAQATPTAPQKNVTTPEAIHQPTQAGPGTAPALPIPHAPSGANVGVAPPLAPDHRAQQRATASETRQPASEMPATHAPGPTPPPTAAGHPPGPPDFARLPSARQGPKPPPNPAQAAPAAIQKSGPAPEPIHQPTQAGPGPASTQAGPGPAPTPPTAHVPPSANTGVAPSPAPDLGAQQRAAAEAAARQQAARQAQQRAAAEAAARQQAVAAQQAQQRAAAEAGARQQAAQQAQQRAAAEAAARQQAVAAQQAQQRAAAEASARQQAAQQAQQRVAAGVAAKQQHADSCGHPSQPPCPK